MALLSERFALLGVREQICLQCHILSVPIFKRHAQNTYKGCRIPIFLLRSSTSRQQAECWPMTVLHFVQDLKDFARPVRRDRWSVCSPSKKFWWKIILFWGSLLCIGLETPNGQDKERSFIYGGEGNHRSNTEGRSSRFGISQGPYKIALEVYWRSLGVENNFLAQWASWDFHSQGDYEACLATLNENFMPKLLWAPCKCRILPIIKNSAM